MDPGTRVTGWGVIESIGPAGGGPLRLQLVAAGTVRTDPEAPISRRLATIHAGLARVLVDHAPGAAAVEEAFAGLNIKSALRLGEARAVALLAAEQAGCAVHELSPSLVKRVVAGHGAAAKDSVKAAVLRILGIAPDDPRAEALAVDAADALALAIAARTRLDVRPELQPRPGALGRRPRRRRWTTDDVKGLLGN